MQGFRLTDRDIECFKEFFNYNALTATQLVNLEFFPNEKKARERLAMLHQGGYLDYCDKPYFGCGRPERLYYLKQRKANEILQLLGYPRDEACLTKPSAYSPLLLHQLAITDFVICVRQACKQCGNYEAKIIPEYKQLPGKVTKLKKSIAQSVVIEGVDTEIIPDGLICLNRKQETAKSLLFFEIYRGTQTLEGGKQNIRSKIEAYVAYWEQGLYKDFADLFSYDFKGFRVLLIVQPVSYLGNLKEICSHIAPAGLFWLALSEHISPDSFFKPIWHVSGETELKALARKEKNEKAA
jgi:hypothetical protein